MDNAVRRAHIQKHKSGIRKAILEVLGFTPLRVERLIFALDHPWVYRELKKFVFFMEEMDEENTSFDDHVNQAIEIANS